MTELHSLIRAEREAFLDLMTEASEEQWLAESLCDGWSVENVAAHLAWAPVAGMSEMIPAFFRSGANMNRLIADSARRWSTRGRPAILHQLRQNIDNQAKPLGVPRIAVLLDAVIHGFDVRIPLGLEREVSDEVFVTLADWLLRARWPLTSALGGTPAVKFRDTRLVVPEAHWSWGAGVPHEASRRDMLLLLTGRTASGTP